MSKFCECKDRISDGNIYFQLNPKQWYLKLVYGNWLLIKLKLDEGCPYCRLPLPMSYEIVDKQYKV